MACLRWLLSALVLVAAPALGAATESACELYGPDTFPYGTVWWRIDPARGRARGVGDLPEGRAAYLVTGVRPDGVLIQNREARYPRLLGWKVLAESQISTDGRRSWRRGCRE